jgi:uncharacterized protein
MAEEPRPPLPPFTAESAARKARAAEDAWNTRDPARVAGAYTPDSIAVRFAYEWRDDSGHWFRSYGNENWAFAADGRMRERHASINDLPITEDERLFRWTLGQRPAEHPGLTELGL